MDYRSYEWKIIYVLVIIFTLIQAGVFIGLSRQNETIARETLELELSTGAEVLNRLLRLRHRTLEQAARVLAAEMPLRDAVLREDLAEAERILREHEGRIPSTVLLLTDTSDKLLIAISSPSEELDPDTIQLRSPEYAQAAREPLVILIDRDGGLIYQTITVPVSSALPVAWLTIGYPIADSLIQTLDNVANTKFSFLSHEPGGEWREHGATFPAQEMDRLLPQFSRSSSESQTLHGDLDDYLVMPFVLSGFENLELVAMVGKSLDQAMRPFNQLQRNLFVWVVAGGLISALAIYMVTRRMVGPLNAMAHVDTLTGLPNRRAFDVAVNAICSLREASNATPKSQFAVILLDMDGFQEINEAQGHTAGDQVLHITADRLRDTLRKSDVIARYGGAEFAILMPNADKAACERVAEMILESLERKIPVEDQELEVGINIGVAVAPPEGANREDLLRKAGLAMQSARRSGRGFMFADD
jgi:diguanylate cyclase (GGDEF)-like protein